MRYLALAVGITMVLGGLGALILGIVRIVQFMASIGASSFECSGSACDVLGDAPQLIGGGIVLLVLGIFVTTIAGSTIAFRRGNDPGRWKAFTRMQGLVPNRLGQRLPAMRGASPGAGAAPQGLTTWSSPAGGQMLPEGVAPIVTALLQGLGAAGLLPGNQTEVQVLDPATRRPIPGSAAPDGRTDAERARDLRATGTLGQAIVESFRQLPVNAGEATLYELFLNVTPEGEPAYRLRHMAMVPARWAYRVANGATLPVWVDAHDPSRLLIDWERS